MKMSIFNKDVPLKIMVENFNRLEKLDLYWVYKYNEENVLLTNLNKVHIQGKICKTAGFSNEIFILDDGTGKAKITRGSQVPGDFSWLKAGLHCSVVGTLIDNGKLPHIAAIKIAKLSNKILQEMWPWEVMELENLITYKIFPKLA